MKYMIVILLFVVFLVACDDNKSTIDDDEFAMDPLGNEECVRLYKETEEKAKKIGGCKNSITANNEHFNLEKCRVLYKEAKEKCLAFLQKDYKILNQKTTSFVPTSSY